MSSFPDKKDCWTQIHDMLIDEDSLGKVKFVHLAKVTVNVKAYWLKTKRSRKDDCSTSKLLDKATWVVPWIRGSKTKLGAPNLKSCPQDERAKRAKVCGTSGSARQGFTSAPVKLD